MRVLGALVGLGMFLGFAALTVVAGRELNAFPAAPRRLTVRDAVAIEAPGDGAWVVLTDVKFPCAHQLTWAGSEPYRLGFGDDDDVRVVVNGRRPCSDAPVEVEGVLHAEEPGHVRDLEFAGYPWAAWPRKQAHHLWTGEGPENSRGLLLLMPGFSLLGLVVVLAFARGKERTAPVLRAVAGTVDGEPWRDDERVLPTRPLRFAATPVMDRAVTVFALLVLGWILFSLGWTAHLHAPGWLGWLGFVVFGGLGAVLFVGVARLVRVVREVVEFGTSERHEALARILETKSDHGSLHVTFEHPVTKKPTTRVMNARESGPMSVDGFLFVAWASNPDALIVLSEEFFPFELTPVEQRDSARRLLRWRRSLG